MILRCFMMQFDTYKGFVAIQSSFSGNNLIPDYENTKDILLSKYNIDVLNDIYELTKTHNAERDYYDAGHLDVSGAAKVSSHFADFLLEKGIGKNVSIDTEKWLTDYNAYVESFSNELNS